MLSSAFVFVLLGLGHVASAIPQANYLIPRPPATETVTSLIEVTNEVTVTVCGSQCATTITVTESAPHSHACGPPSSSSKPTTLTSATLPWISIPPRSSSSTNYVISNSDRSYSSTLKGTGSSSASVTKTTVVGTTVVSQLPSAGTLTSTSTWRANNTLTKSLSLSLTYITGTGTIGTISRLYPSSSVWSNTTRSFSKTRTGATTTNVVLPTATVSTLSSISSVAETTSAPCTTYGCPSYTTLTYTTVINTTVSDQLPGASTLLTGGTRSASRTTLRSTIVVTVTRSVPSSTGTAYSSSSFGTFVSSRYSSKLTRTSSIRLSATLSYGTTTTASSARTYTTSRASMESTSDSTAISTPESSARAIPCTSHAESTSSAVSSLRTTVQSALPSTVTSSSSISGSYEYTVSSSKATIQSAKPSVVTVSTAITGGYDDFPTPSPKTTVNSAKPSLVTSIPGGYEYPSASGDLSSTKHDHSTRTPGTTVESALPSLVTPSSARLSSSPTTFVTQTNGESLTSSVSIPGGYELNH
ncbi:uncharacterized protein CTRU02_211636 [Colletotrichum truncatum]|uniref:Uncharacterized protein n=1 Tax=Colletotrichum truncatum TaxID=5467 RepID=A0ACC3YL84_COLTU|nr:uncharacterized protein CTRU02_14624 [Colletotrichum truncatum]KAF6781943.1 hypothetical protein CTRU02_14624 [Colletotrichum truncatum]